MRRALKDIYFGCYILMALDYLHKLYKKLLDGRVYRVVAVKPTDWRVSFNDAKKWARSLESYLEKYNVSRGYRVFIARVPPASMSFKIYKLVSILH